MIKIKNLVIDFIGGMIKIHYSPCEFTLEEPKRQEHLCILRKDDPTKNQVVHLGTARIYHLVTYDIVSTLKSLLLIDNITTPT